LGATPNLRDDALSLWDGMAINKGIRNVLYLFLEHLSEREKSPTLSFAKVGSEIMVTIETLFFVALMAAFSVMIGGCVSAATAPLCWALGALLGIIIPILTFLTATLWAAGVSLGIYLPLVPYLVFTFTALGWLLLV